jgi:transcriptional pleiotropic regulator of transition state genes
MQIKIIRKIDRLGRIVIPNDIRKTLKLQSGDTVEIKVENGAVIVKKEVEK